MCKYVIRIIGDSGLILYWAGGSWDSVVNDAVLYEKAEAVQCIKEFKKDYLPRSGEWALGIQELTLD